MKLVDVNVLLNAVNSDSDEHPRACEWLESASGAPAGIGFAWIVVVGFVRIATRRGILAKPLPVEDALGLVDEWLNAPRARIVEPTSRHWPTLSRLLIGAGTAGNLTTDAHLAALAIEHGATVASFDRDFERFAGLSFELLKA
jgi:uncharacterized protein